jgi:hypothetical protein
MSQLKGDVGKRGPRRGEAVERQPPGEAERAASRAEDNQPLDARTKKPIEPPDRGRMERPESNSDRGKDRQGLADTADREPHDHGS